MGMTRTRPAIHEAPDAYPQLPPTLPPAAGGPASFEDLDPPVAIDLSADADEGFTIPLVRRLLAEAQCSSDQVYAITELRIGPVRGRSVFLTKQAEETWYAGVPRGRRLVLRLL